MHGIAPPLVTPFTESGRLDDDRLRELVGWLEDRGVHFLVPCGSTSEAELMTVDERARVIEVVADEASVPVLAGCGHPGYRETMASIEAAADVGADGAMVVTPFYYTHDQATLAQYYRDVADAAAIPIYLYSVPVFTHVRLEPDTVGELAAHPGVVGLKDSSGSLEGLVRTSRRVDGEFTLLVGAASLLGAALDVGAAGGILAVANLRPETATRVVTEHGTDPDRARELTATLGEVHAAAFEYGIPGLKWAMRERGAPAGRSRSPHRRLDDDEREALRAALVDADG